MSESIVHRGPDGEGFYEAPGVALAHRRLAIIDLDGGQQPMVSADQRQVLVFNGEIYNYRELRAKLQAEGVLLRTKSDTEVILEGWRVWGERTLDLLRGMYAFGLYDRSLDTLFLARDHFGIKPLFYGRLRDGSLAFASELSALWTLGAALDNQLRSDAILDYFAFGYIPDPKTIYQSLHKLPAAHSLRIVRGAAALAAQRYWVPVFPEPQKISEQDAVAGTLAVIEESVRAHLVADVPISTFLSGGIDSGTVTTLTARNAPGILAHTISFKDPRFDESASAATVARISGLDHHLHAVDVPEPSDVVGILQAYHEPYADSSCIPMFALCRAASAESKVALTGDGGDELFGGYNWYMSHLLRARLIGAMPGWLASAVGSLGRGVNSWRWPAAVRPKGGGFLASFDRSAARAFVAAQSVLPYAALDELFVPEFLRAANGHDPYGRFCERNHTLANGESATDSFRQAQSIDMHLYLPGDVLTKVDRASMRCGLEVRVPFLDRKVFEWVASLPSERILLHGQRKGLLIAAARALLPAVVLEQPKRGFSVPLDAWFRGALMSILQERMDAAGAALNQIVDRRFVSEIMARHLGGRLQAGTFLFALLSFSVFLTRQMR